MTGQINLENFNSIYDDTYKTVLKYVVTNCSNIDDVNDIIQDTYYEFYCSLSKKQNLNISNIKSYIIGISKNILRKHYGLLYKLKTVSLFTPKDDIELLDILDDETDFEEIIIDKINLEDIWKFLKTKKVIISKVFYLYYTQDMTIKEIAKNLNITEASVKHYIYRTLKQINMNLKKESE